MTKRFRYNDYGAIFGLPLLIQHGVLDSFIIDLSDASFIDGAELTYIRCLMDLANLKGVKVGMDFPKDKKVFKYAQGMRLFRGLEPLDDPFFNSRLSSFIPLTKINSDKNQFLYSEFEKIFNGKNLAMTSLSDLCVAFTELADNMYCHPGLVDNSGWGYVHAQVYPDKIKIHFTDVGVGFESAYKRSRTDRGRGVVQLIIDSLKPLESRLNFPGEKAVRGIGLDEAMKLVANNGGKLTIHSGYGMIRIIDKQPPRPVPTIWNFCGTQISMEVRI